MRTRPIWVRFRAGYPGARPAWTLPSGRLGSCRLRTEHSLCGPQPAWSHRSTTTTAPPPHHHRPTPPQPNTAARTARGVDRVGVERLESRFRAGIGILGNEADSRRNPLTVSSMARRRAQHSVTRCVSHRHAGDGPAHEWTVAISYLATAGDGA